MCLENVRSVLRHESHVIDSTKNKLGVRAICVRKKEGKAFIFQFNLFFFTLEELLMGQPFLTVHLK